MKGQASELLLEPPPSANKPSVLKFPSRMQLNLRFFSFLLYSVLATTSFCLAINSAHHATNTSLTPSAQNYENFRRWRTRARSLESRSYRKAKQYGEQLKVGTEAGIIIGCFGTWIAVGVVWMVAALLYCQGERLICLEG